MAVSKAECFRKALKINALGAIREKWALDADTPKDSLTPGTAESMCDNRGKIVSLNVKFSSKC